jgi:hypothetical protein
VVVLGSTPTTRFGRIRLVDNQQSFTMLPGLLNYTEPELVVGEHEHTPTYVFGDLSRPASVRGAFLGLVLSFDFAHYIFYDVTFSFLQHGVQDNIALFIERTYGVCDYTRLDRFFREFFH